MKRKTNFSIEVAPQGANTGTKGFWCGLSTRGWQCPVPVLLPSKGKEGDHASLVCRVRHPGSLLTWCPTGKEGLVLESDSVLTCSGMAIHAEVLMQKLLHPQPRAHLPSLLPCTQDGLTLFPAIMQCCGRGTVSPHSHPTNCPPHLMPYFLPPAPPRDWFLALSACVSLATGSNLSSTYHLHYEV